MSVNEMFNQEASVLSRTLSTLPSGVPKGEYFYLIDQNNARVTSDGNGGWYTELGHYFSQSEVGVISQITAAGGVYKPFSTLATYPQAGASTFVSDVGQGVEVTSDGVAYRGAERYVNGFSVSASGDLLLNGKYCRELGVNAYNLITTLVTDPTSTHYKTILDECANMDVIS